MQDLRHLWNFGHLNVAKGAKKTCPHDESPLQLAVLQTPLRLSQSMKRAVFTLDLFTCSARCPEMGKGVADPFLPCQGPAWQSCDTEVHRALAN